MTKIIGRSIDLKKWKPNPFLVPFKANADRFFKQDPMGEDHAIYLIDFHMLPPEPSRRKIIGSHLEGRLRRLVHVAKFENKNRRTADQKL